MSTFEHLFGLINLYAPLSKENPEKTQDFLEHSFAVLDAWMDKANEEEKHEAWRYSQKNGQAFVSMWWFQQEQKQPTQWKNAWNSDKFTYHVLTAGLYNGAEKYLLQRMQWAAKHNDWDFFNWDEKFIKRVVPKLCNSNPENPALAEILVGLNAHNLEMFSEISNFLPTKYIEEHSHIIPFSRSFLAQHQLINDLETRQHHHILRCLNKHHTDLAQGPLQNRMGLAVYNFWSGYQGSISDQISSSLETIAANLAQCFPQNISQVLPPLGMGQCEHWRIVSHISNPTRLTWFVQEKTSNMLTSLFIFPQMNQWVDFWKTTMSIPNWNQQMTDADDQLYFLNSNIRLSKTTNVKNIEEQIAPHWEFFERQAPKMGRALAAVISFLGGSPPERLCNFSNLFSFNNCTEKFPQGFEQFIQAHIQKHVLTQSIGSKSSIKCRKI